MASGGGSRLKMAVTGFAGTGKTTLCEALGEHFALPVLGEDMGAITAANQEAERVLRFAYSTAAERSAAREASIEAYVAWAGKRARAFDAHPGFVADRWELDLVNWWLVHFGLGTNDVDHVTSRLLSDLREKSARLDYMVLMPFQSPFAAAGSQNHDLLGRKIDFTTHTLFRTVTVGLMREFAPVRVIQIPPRPMTVVERVDHVAKLIAEDRARIRKAN